MSDDDMTTGEAEAWRAGWRAARDAAARAAFYASVASGLGLGRARVVRDDIRAMEPPAAITNPPGRALEGKQ